MSAAANLSPREVAELAGAPKRVVEKAIEEGLLRVHSRTARGPARRTRRMLAADAVAYAALITKLDIRLTVAQKKRLLARLSRLRPGEFRKARVEVAPAVEIDVGRLIGDVMEKAERYRANRDAWIAMDEEILGGTPIVRGTRMTVYSVLGRVEHGETVDDILADNPDLSSDAIQAAIVYARTHPLIGRPGGRPWVSAV